MEIIINIVKKILGIIFIGILLIAIFFTFTTPQISFGLIISIILLLAVFGAKALLKVEIDEDKFYYKDKTDDLIWAITIFLFYLALGILILYYGINIYTSFFSNNYINKSIFIFIINLINISPVLIVMYFRKEEPVKIGITRKYLFSSLFLGLICSGFYIVKLFGTVKTFNVELFASLIITTLYALNEEILFRGYMQTSFSAKFGKWKGLFIVAVIFIFSHIPNKMMMSGMSFGNALASCLILFPSAFIMGLLYMMTQNICAPLIFHILLNFSTVPYK